MEIKNLGYHKLSFGEIDQIREKIISGEINLYIKITQLYLYLNQMNKKYSLILILIQNTTIITLIAGLIFLFINWKISILLGVFSLIIGCYQSIFAMKFIRKNCLEDHVFLKFALVVELVKISDKNSPIIDPIYKQFNTIR